MQFRYVSVIVSNVLNIISDIALYAQQNNWKDSVIENEKTNILDKELDVISIYLNFD